MTSTDKQALRRAIRARFPGEGERNRESALICRHVMAWEVYRRARVVGGYVPLPREADVTPLLADVLASGKTLLLPRVEGERRMTLRLVERLDKLTTGRWGLLEPAADAPVVPAGEADLLLVPLEGVDRSGMRLGKGGGYYDALLRGKQVMKLGIALSWQWVGRVPREAWDQPLDAAADRDGIHVFNG